MPPDVMRLGISPLRMIFWGALLCVLDLSFSQTTNGVGFRFDLLNDALGMGLIVWGLWQLKEIPVSGSYAALMLGLHIVAIVAFFEAVAGHFIMRWSPPLQCTGILFGLIKLASVIGYCIAMRWFCEVAWFADVAQSWRTTTWLYVVIHAVPLAVLHVFSLGAIVSGPRGAIDLGPLGLLLAVAALIPLIHLFVSIWRTIHRLEGATGPDKPST